MTSSPSNQAELQLYRVMQRASLLAYYDTLLEMGGDDVQQLCDAGEEEFLEIMALVGMASKPLHVRRLQKALQEWVTSPALFQTPLPSGLSPNSNSIASVGGLRSSSTFLSSTVELASLHSPNQNTVSSVTDPVTSPSESPDISQVISEPDSHKCGTNSNSFVDVEEPVSMAHQNPVLVESQISKITELAKDLVSQIPHFEPKPHNRKKKICRNLDTVINMPYDDPRRMDEIRKYSAIYGRFDCKRNPQKPLTLHELLVNEAAAQICRFVPVLLTRRDQLFSLARQVVRDSGCHVTKSASGSTSKTKHHCDGSRSQDEIHLSKKARTSQPEQQESVAGSIDNDKLKIRDRLDQIAQELRILGDKTEELVQAAQKVRQTNDLSAVQSLQKQMESVQSKQTQLLVEQSELLKQPLPSRHV
ncbi:hypothetical protein RUM43_007423 [Polyplax serrata]|uniref:Uncharacterized protein n=1 Tax=Polyplax serrata TaxID=468196 RepID=A0AAN8S1L3_POLSC